MIYTNTAESKDDNSPVRIEVCVEQFGIGPEYHLFSLLEKRQNIVTFSDMNQLWFLKLKTENWRLTYKMMNQQVGVWLWQNVKISQTDPHLYSWPVHKWCHTEDLLQTNLSWTLVIRSSLHGYEENWQALWFIIVVISHPAMPRHISTGPCPQWLTVF